MARDRKLLKGRPRVFLSSKKYLAHDRRRTRSLEKDKVCTIDDVYEYTPSRVRRAKVALAFDRHEIKGHQHDLGDKTDLTGLGRDAMEKLRMRLMQDDMDEDTDGHVGSEDDEDIHSEDAFEESDREVFAGSEFMRQGAMRRQEASRSGHQVAKEVDLNEDFDVLAGDPDSRSDSEDREGEGEGDVLDVFDGRADMDDDENPLPTLNNMPHDTATEVHAVEGDESRTENADATVDEEGEEREAEDGDDEEDNGGDNLWISASDSGDPSPEALVDLENFLSTLDPVVSDKRKPDELVQPDPIKRRRIDDRTEAGEESEFGIPGSGTLKLDDLLAPLSSASLVALKRSTKSLTSSNSKMKMLSAPLPQRAQERLDREAAYERTKEEVDKWSATMKRIKEAEHLAFPLQAKNRSCVSNLELAAKFAPSNELESAVDKLLKAAQLRDQDITHTEALKMAHLSVEEVAARRAQLRTMRELVFRADRKAKRIAKIKSKTYRRIRKKQRERVDTAGGHGDGDGTVNGNVDAEDEAERLKAEVQRAKERATLRHKHTGKWARAMKGRQGLHQDQRQAISEMLERSEKLRRRIHGENSDDEGSEDSESEVAEQDEGAIKRSAFEELAALRTEDDDVDLPGLQSKSVFNMKFMRDAAARQSREADALAEELQNEIGLGISEEADGHDDETGAIAGAPPKETAIVQRTGGRLSFQPGTTPGSLRPLGSLASDTSSVTLQSADLLQDIPTPGPKSTPSPSAPTPAPTPTSVPNPWLVHTTSSGPSRKRNEARAHKDADASTKSSYKLKKQAGKHQDEKERAKDDAVLDIDANKALAIPDPPLLSAPSRKNKEKKAGRSAANMPDSSTHMMPDDASDSDAASEIEAQESALGEARQGKGVQAFKQRDLVALAFAGDNVVQAFEEAKQQETEADAPREVDTTLPGWGTWGGTGTKKRPPKPHLIKSVPGIPTDARADHAKPHVIISERRDKKAARYLVQALPHPYTSHAQYERRMETPLGSEWNTRLGFQRATMPRVVTKMGTVIDPLEKLF